MVEHSKGDGLCLGLFLGFGVLWIIGKKRLFGKSELAGLSLGFLWPLVSVFAYFRAQHSIGIMVEDWLWPLRHYTSANRVLYGYQNWSDDTRHLIFGTGPAVARMVKTLGLIPGFLVPAPPLVAIAILVYCVLQTFRPR